MLEQCGGAAGEPLNGHSVWATKEVLAYDDLGGLFEVTTKAGTTYATQVVRV